jgi:hypothetical protein
MMRNLLALFALVLLAFVGTGLGRGWYRIQGQPSEQGTVAFRLEIAHARMAADIVGAVKSVFRVLTRTEEEKAAEPGR